jgi:hypothetical protein
MTKARNIANTTLTLGSTSLSLGSTTTTLAGLTLTSPIISAITNTGTITLPTTTGTLALTGQTFYIGTQAIAINATTGTITSLPGVTSVNGTTIPSAATLLTSTSTASALTSFGTSPTITTPVIDSISASAVGAATSLHPTVTTGSIAIGAGLTTGALNIATVGTGITPITIGHTNALIGLTGNTTITGITTANSFIPSSSTIPTNGIYLPASNTIGIASNSIQRMTFDGNGTVGFISQIMESVTLSATSAATTVIYDIITNRNILYYTSAATGNWTLNVRGDVSTTLNALMAVGQALTIVFMNTNTGTAYYPTAFQIDGVAVTPKWSGGTVPSAGNINSIDVYTYNIFKTASATYTVLASQGKYA